MKDKIQYIAITNDDLVWITNKILQDFNDIQNSEESQEDKNSKIAKLAFRAIEFGLKEVADKLGYEVHYFPLKGKEDVSLIMPKNMTEKDFEILYSRIELLKETCPE